jgi:hypothetical protein
MPLIKIDALEGRSPSEVTTLLDAVHRAVVKAFHVPVRDRYQVYQAHPKGFLVIQDTGLNISRTDKADHHGGKQEARRSSEAQILQGTNGAVGKLSFDRSQRRYGRNR